MNSNVLNVVPCCVPMYCESVSSRKNEESSRVLSYFFASDSHALEEIGGEFGNKVCLIVFYQRSRHVRETLSQKPSKSRMIALCWIATSM